MRTTLSIDDRVLAEYKRLAARSHRTLSHVIQDALVEMLARRREAAERGPVKLPVIGGGGLRPGVDLDDSAGLLAIADEDADRRLGVGAPDEASASGRLGHGVESPGSSVEPEEPGDA